MNVETAEILVRCKCLKCNGTGRVKTAPEPYWPEEMHCLQCKGSGYTEEYALLEEILSALIKEIEKNK